MSLACMLMDWRDPRIRHLCYIEISFQFHCVFFVIIKICNQGKNKYYSILKQLDLPSETKIVQMV